MARKRRRPKTVKASKGGIVRVSSKVDWIKAEAGDEGQSDELPKFKIDAYTGTAVNVGWGWPVVIDIMGMTYADKIIIALNHRMAELVGHSTEIKRTQKLIQVFGVVSMEDATQAAVTVTTGMKNEFPWQASIGAMPIEGEVYFVEQGAKLKANGRTFKGPCYYVAKSELFETSFVPLGADSNTSAVAASRRKIKMNFTEWLEANHPEIDFLEADAETQESILAEYQASKKTKTEPSPQPKKVAAGAATPHTEAGGDGASASDDVNYFAIRAQQMARVATIDKKLGQYPDIAAQALQDEAAGNPWTERQMDDRLELQRLRDGRPTAPSGSSGGSENLYEEKTVIAGICLASGCSTAVVEKYYGDKVLEAAEKMRGVGLRGAIELRAASKGVNLPMYGMGRREWLRAASTSTIDAPGMFEEICNRTLESLMPEEPGLSTDIAVNRPVKDFRKIKRYLLDGGEPWAEVTKDGKLQHMSARDGVPMEVEATTFGQILVFTRQDEKNDDLGAIQQFAEMMGRGFYDMISSELGKILYNKKFLTGRYTSGGGAAFTYENIKAGQDAMRAERVKTGKGKSKSRSVGAKHLIHGGNLDTSQRELFGADKIVLIQNGLEITVSNPFRGVLTPFLFEEAGNPDWFDGSQYYAPMDDSWWLTAGNMGHFAPIEISWVDNVRTPMIENFVKGEEWLGFGIRGYVDCGFNALRNEGIRLYQPSA